MAPETPAAPELARIRALAGMEDGDAEGYPPEFGGEQLAYYYDLAGGDVYGAARLALRAVAARIARTEGTIVLGNLRADGVTAAAELRAMADAIRAPRGAFGLDAGGGSAPATEIVGPARSGGAGEDQVARAAAARAQGEIDAHEASEHNTDRVARRAAESARQLAVRVDGRFPVQHDDLAFDIISSRNLRAEAVTEVILADGAVTGSKIPNNTILGRHIQANSITTEELAADSVRTEDIRDGAVTQEKLAPGVGGGGLNTVATGDGIDGDGTAGDPLELRYSDRDFGIVNVAARGDPPEGQLVLSQAVRDKASRYPDMGAAATDGFVVAWSNARGRFELGNPPPPSSLESIELPAKSFPRVARRGVATQTWTLAEVRRVEGEFTAPTGDFLLSAILSDRSEFSVEHVEWETANNRVSIQIRNIGGPNARGGDGYTGRVTLNVLRGAIAGDGVVGLNQQQVDSRIAEEVAPEALRGNADSWPGDKTAAGLFQAAGDEQIPGAGANIVFAVSENVEDTEAAGTSFTITEQQANQPGAFITAAYVLSVTLAPGDLPNDVELLYQVRDTGAVVGSHNLKIIPSGREMGYVHFPVGEAGAKRWAVRVGDGHGGYSGTLLIREVRYHAGVPVADDYVKRIVAPELNTEKEERQRVEAQLEAEIEEAKNIVAITDALPVPNQVQRKTNMVWRDDIPFRQATGDALQAPATGYVQVILGNFGATAITPVEYCVGRREIVYAVGTHEISVEWDNQRRAIIEAKDGLALSALAGGIANTNTGLVMLHYNRARRGGTDTGSPSWERVLGLQETLASSRDLTVRHALGTIALPRAAFPQTWEISAIAEIAQNDADDDDRRFRGHLSFTNAGADVFIQGGDRIGDGVAAQLLMTHDWTPGPGGDDDVWRATQSGQLQRIFIASGAGDVTLYLWGQVSGKMRNLRVYTRVVA